MKCNPAPLAFISACGCSRAVLVGADGSLDQHDGLRLEIGPARPRSRRPSTRIGHRAAQRLLSPVLLRSPRFSTARLPSQRTGKIGLSMLAVQNESLFF